MKLSIITINFNNRDGLRRTIESVAAQTCKDFEYIVVDGGSTDGSKDIILANSEHISSWVSEPDSGIYNAMNKAVRMATGDYCLHINSGDFLAGPDVVARLLPELDGTHDFITGFPTTESGGRDYKNVPDVLTGVHLVKNCMSHESTCIKRDLLIRFPYDESLRIASDYKFFIEAYFHGDATYKKVGMDVSICNYDGISCTNSELLRQEKEQILSSGILSKNLLKEIMLEDPDIMDVLTRIPNGFGIRRMIARIDSAIVSIYKLFKRN